MTDDDLHTMGATYKALLKQNDDLKQEMELASQHEDYGSLSHSHMLQQSVLQQIRTMEKDIAHAVMAWMEPS